ncbi:Transmembrane protein 214 [Sergentomyia squamirostris]
MSLQWEVVGRSKKSQVKGKSVDLKEFGGVMERTPSIRKTDNGKKGARGDGKKVLQESTKKNQAAKVKVTTSNVKDEKRPLTKKKFKNLEGALKEFSLDELKSQLMVLKETFKNSSLVWLKAILSYLNESLIVIDVDAVFLCRPVLYPATVLPKDLKELIHDELDNAGMSNVQYFYDQSLTSLAEDLNKSLPVMGTRILLQLIALRYPVVCQSNFAKNAVLHNSYLNQSPIGLSLLWALGQGGFCDVQIGINVWQNMMLPVIEMKHYYQFVVDYLFRILQKPPQNASLKLNLQEYLNLIDTIVKPRNNIPHDYRKLLTESAFKISKLYIESTKNVSNIFLTLFKNLSSDSASVYTFTIVFCLQVEPHCVKLWELNYKTLKQQHKILLTYLRESKQGQDLRGNKVLNDFLKSIDSSLVESKKIKNSPSRINGKFSKHQNTQERITSKKGEKATKSSSICPWILGIFVLFGAIGGIIGYDVHLHGGKFEASTTGRFLKDTGALPYVETVWFTTMSYSARGYQWAEENVPVYYRQVSTALEPYCIFAVDFTKVLLNTVKRSVCSACTYIQAKSPIIGNFVDQYIPGFSQKVSEVSYTTWTTVAKVSVDSYHSGCEFFRTKVFVGSLSPENMGKVMSDAQAVAVQYYSWFHDKVDAYAKIK